MFYSQAIKRNDVTASLAKIHCNTYNVLAYEYKYVHEKHQEVMCSLESTQPMSQRSENKTMN